MAGGNTAYSWARIPLPAPFRESSPRPRAVVSPMSSSQGGILKIPASLALGAGPPAPPPPHTPPPPALCRNSVLASLDSQLSTSSGSRERPPNSPAPGHGSAHNRLSLDARTPAPLACILETTSQSPPDTTAGTLGFMLAAAPPRSPQCTPSVPTCALIL